MDIKKPTHNLVYCIGCNRSKQLFESESKANNFLRFNVPNFEDESKVPVRSYYCSFCCGWHITSIVNDNKAKACEERDAKLMRSLESRNKNSLTLTSKRKEIKEKLSNIGIVLEKCRLELCRGNLPLAQELFDDSGRMLLTIENLVNQNNINRSVLSKYLSKIQVYERAFERINDPAFSEEERGEYLHSSDEQTQNKDLIWLYLNAVELNKELERLYSEAEVAKSEGNTTAMNDCCNQIKTLLTQNSYNGINQKRKEYFEKIDILIRGVSCQDSYAPPKKRQNKKLIISIIKTLEDAHESYRNGEYEKCINLIKTAECLMPDNGTNEETVLWNSIKQLKERLMLID